MISINSHLCVRCRKAPLISQPNELREKISYPLVCAPVQLIYSVFYLTFVEKKNNLRSLHVFLSVLYVHANY